MYYMLYIYVIKRSTRLIHHFIHISLCKNLFKINGKKEKNILRFIEKEGKYSFYSFSFYHIFFSEFVSENNTQHTTLLLFF